MIRGGAGRALKRLVDVIGSIVGLVVLSPLVAVAAVVSRLRQGSPVLYAAPRVGLDDRPFDLWKLRTMTDERDADGALLSDSVRITAFGQTLRTWSIDEVPQLWNVLRGDMSLVGPRPLPVAYLGRYSDEERRRHTVRPGVTGWAQVHGRNAVSWDERLALDVWYVEHRTVLLDLRILVRTVGQVVGRHGISAAGQATMGELRPEFASRVDPTVLTGTGA